MEEKQRYEKLKKGEYKIFENGVVANFEPTYKREFFLSSLVFDYG